MSGELTDEQLNALDRQGLLKSNAVRDQKIRKRFKELRAGGNKVEDVIEELKTEFNLSKGAIDKIVYKRI